MIAAESASYQYGRPILAFGDVASFLLMGAIKGLAKMPEGWSLAQRKIKGETRYLHVCCYQAGLVPRAVILSGVPVPAWSSIC